MKTLLLTILLLVACGKEVAPPAPGPEPIPTPHPKVLIEKRLLIFSAPWCEPCHRLHMELKGKTEQYTKSEVIVYVQTGQSQSSPPTEESCRVYKEKLGVSYAFVPDPWKSQTYKKYLGSQVIIPAAVLLDMNGNVLQKFPAGTFSAQELLSYLSSAF